MRRRWVRIEASSRQDLLAGLSAGLLGAGVGLAAFYIVRLLLAREPLVGAGLEDANRTAIPLSDEDAR